MNVGGIFRKQSAILFQSRKLPTLFGNFLKLFNTSSHPLFPFGIPNIQIFDMWIDLIFFLHFFISLTFYATILKFLYFIFLFLGL